VRLPALSLVIVAAGCSKHPPRVVCLADAGPVRVDRCAVPDRTVRFALATGGGTEPALDGLIDRELLAQAALAAGVRAPAIADVRRSLEQGDALAMGAELPPGMFVGDDGGFDASRLIRFSQSFGLPDADAFLEEQVREQLARVMRDRLGDELAAWLSARCAEVLAAGKLTIDPALADGYEPCITAP